MSSRATTAGSGGVILIAGGGTGGHVYPALAIGDELRAQGCATVFVGTARGLESRLIPERGLELELVRVEGIRGRGLRALRAAARLPLALLDAWRILRRHRPRAVVGVGGYASGPIVALAALLRYPTLIEEQNVSPGLTNRLLGRLVGDIALPAEEARGAFGGRGFVAGVPVRRELGDQKKKRGATGRCGSWSLAAARVRPC